MTCANLFLNFQQTFNGFAPPFMDLDEESMDRYLRGSHDVTTEIFGDCLLVEGELESLLEQTSQVLGFTLSLDIMRSPEIPCRDSSCADRREDAIAFMMLTHGRLGESSALHHLSENVLELVVKEAMGRPWGIFRRDVEFGDFLGLVARHIHANVQRQELQVVLSKFEKAQRGLCQKQNTHTSHTCKNDQDHFPEFAFLLSCN